MGLKDKLKGVAVRGVDTLFFGVIGPLAVAKHHAKLSLISSHYDLNGHFTFMQLNNIDRSKTLSKDVDDFGNPVSNLFVYEDSLIERRARDYMLIFDEELDHLPNYEKVMVKPYCFKKHSIIKPADDGLVKGSLLKVQPFELDMLDDLYGVAYSRVPVKLLGGEEAWVYSSFKHMD